MKYCMFCKKVLGEIYIENKVGYFCSEDHYDEFLESLSKEEYIELQNSFCVCSDE